MQRTEKGLINLHESKLNLTNLTKTNYFDII